MIFFRFKNGQGLKSIIQENQITAVGADNVNAPKGTVIVLKQNENLISMNTIEEWEAAYKLAIESMAANRYSLIAVGEKQPS